MAQPGSLLDIGDKIASIVGAAVAVLGLAVALRSGRERSRGGRTRAAVITLAAVGFSLALLLVLPGVPAVVSRAAAWSIVPLLAGMAVLLGRVRRERRRPDPGLTALLEAQRADATRHRYRFFGHVPALTELYVRQRVRLGGRGEGEGSRTINAVQVLRAQRHAVVLGDAGAGKSIFLAMVADELARHQLAGRPAGEFAVSVHASDLASLHLPQALAQAVQRDLDITLPSSTFEKPPAVGRSWRVLVDGLDEVADAHKRSTVLWRIRDLLAADSHYRFLIASRPLTESELLELRGPTVGEYELRPFDRADLAEFAARWFVARHPTDLRRAKQQAALFQARVAGARLGPVARIPLLATIAALVFEQERERALPSSRAALYERFVQHLLNGQPSLARLRQAAEPELLSRGVGGRAVAQWLWSDIDVHVSELLDTCGAAWLGDPGVRLTDVAGTWVTAHTRYDLTRVSPDGGQMLRDLLLATGVFTLHRDRVAFAHQSFAEYFAARAGEPTFDPERWRVQAANPATRSLAGFAAARRPDSDRLVTGLLDSANVVAAGDLLADGVPVAAATRTRIVDSLLRQITDESEQAPDALRILGELSVDTDVLARMTGVVLDPDVSVWARAFIADRVADIESAAGIKLLRSLMPHASSAELEWIVNTLEERGARINPELDLPQPGEAPPDGGKPLGVLGQHALRQRLADVSASDRERLEAARHLADSGDLEPLRAMVDAVDISRLQRVGIAVALADAGDPETLRLLATRANLERWPPADPADGLRASFAAGVDLFGRGDRHALGVLRAIVDEAPDYPMAFGAAAHLADAGDLNPLSKLAQGSGQPQVRIAAARRLAQMGGDVVVLERALNGALRPQAEALILVELLHAGRLDVLPRLDTLLATHRFEPELRTQLRYPMALHGDRRAREALFRATRQRPGSHASVQAAVALTALGDARGTEHLRRIARQQWRRARTRTRAVVGLVQTDATVGRPLLERLAGAHSAPQLRLRTATISAESWGDLAPLAWIALADALPLRHRREAVETIADVLAEVPEPGLSASLRARILALATDDTTPATLRVVVAARLLPAEEASTVLSDIAHTRGGYWSAARSAAITHLARIDRRAAANALSHLVRDDRMPRLRRWWIILQLPELLPADEYGILEDRLDEADDGGAWSWVMCMARLTLTPPERLFGPLPTPETETATAR